ncbi:MAG: translation initiation factor IF-3 [Akkermansiaceae bacterium]|nr:translation initiation factor IF-3 [Akkermansiaceae bacterium]NNM30904.1 translation initiation factor IF-3 [Akkermansiaceae bacterium]
MTRVNDRIRAPRVRVVSKSGEQLGVMDTREAVQKAKAVGLDLVEVASNADPPVCRVVDYGKWKYEQSKLKKHKSKSATRMKEVKFRVRTEEHDYNVKMGRAETFLEGGHKVRMQLQFRGRENAHREIGFEVMERIKGDLKDMAHVDQEPKLAGRAIVMVLSPLPKAQQHRKFVLEHGELIEEDDFDDDDDLEHEDEGAEGASDEGEPAAGAEKAEVE